MENHTEMKLTGTAEKMKRKEKSDSSGLCSSVLGNKQKIKTSFFFAIHALLLGLWLFIITLSGTVAVGISGGSQVSGVVDSPNYMPGITCC